MPRPPDDEDALFEELLAQVDQAFSALEADGANLSDTLSEGVREALKTALHGATEGQSSGPNVVVLEGGRGDDDDTSEEAPPDLHVAEDPSDVDGSAGPRSSVRVVRVGTRPRVSIQETPLHLEGALLVTAGEAQTVFRGDTARTYRLGCDAGALGISVDGQPADRIGPGQTLDVEARLIRVSSADDKVAVGRYARIS